MKHRRIAVLAAAGAIAVVTLGACATSPAAPPDDTTSETTVPAAAMPQSGTFIADMAEPDGQTMTLGIAVDGDEVTAFATDGTSEEASFVGTQQDGAMTLTSPYQDQLTATFDGSNVNGTITMNKPGAQPHNFSASLVSAPAGMYTVEMGDGSATWVVRPNRTMVGVMMPNSKRDREVIDQINQQQQDFQDKVRQMRLQLQMRQAPTLTYGTWQTTMDGVTMTAAPVTGGMTI